ncbi:MAG: Lipoprotein signal peptidase (Prolipoprotein signalpeptidase) [Parcubacteria group bacterium GW2011_GWC2_45_7]|uniref:Lipoprotein signal peptidase (Prolipoprotein signalpeptidase) n=1 Tax=Candidatus Magasanikbacteria bacterium GW2011_GWA2_50_22 TaxID=1619043 RepID=A0A0G1WFI0_9BACT|nr:MAG: Lipoprotein signal peptidase (Prolipoprotein signalpeptidase) [Parcubacteria group bacterium GW2011_GWC2_45_7]KKW17543.1 MAG: Lipoprotein signal peptidase (Prolipoprotein signalpeptidase) [Candidatus Magasanikbacteria bacterium GW2011_GWA2_50_22]
MRVSLKHKTIVLIIAALVFLADRTTKLYAQSLPDGTAFVITPHLTFGSFLNPALFFLPAWSAISWIALFVLTALIIFYTLTSATPLHLALTPIILGGASNVFDRFAYGGVIDIVSIGNMMTINLSDLLIIAGIVVLILRPATR